MVNLVTLLPLRAHCYTVVIIFHLFTMIIHVFRWDSAKGAFAEFDLELFACVSNLDHTFSLTLA